MLKICFVGYGETYCNSWVLRWSMLDCPLQPLHWRQLDDDDDGDDDEDDDDDGNDNDNDDNLYPEKQRHWREAKSNAVEDFHFYIQAIFTTWYCCYLENLPIVTVGY